MEQHFLIKPNGENCAIILTKDNSSRSLSVICPLDEEMGGDSILDEYNEIFKDNLCSYILDHIADSDISTLMRDAIKSAGADLMLGGNDISELEYALNHFYTLDNGSLSFNYGLEKKEVGDDTILVLPIDDSYPEGQIEIYREKRQAAGQPQPQEEPKSGTDESPSGGNNNPPESPKPPRFPWIKWIIGASALIVIVLLILSFLGLLPFGKKGGGGQKGQPVETLPSVATSPAEVQSDNSSATFYGLVNEDGTPSYKERGFVYSTSPKPSITEGDLRLIVPKDTNRFFNASVSGLVSGSDYYVRSYVVSAKDSVIYGEQVHFKTKSISRDGSATTNGKGVVKKHDNNPPETPGDTTPHIIQSLKDKPMKLTIVSEYNTTKLFSDISNALNVLGYDIVLDSSKAEWEAKVILNCEEKRDLGNSFVVKISANCYTDGRFAGSISDSTGIAPRSASYDVARDEAFKKVYGLIADIIDKKATNSK